MGFKSIEMQIAIPRTQDASRMQDQMMRQGQQFQETLAEQQLKDEFIRRTKVNEHEDVRKKNVDDKEKENHQQANEGEKNNQEQADEGETVHPYLGRNVDFSR